MEVRPDSLASNHICDRRDGRHVHHLFSFANAPTIFSDFISFSLFLSGFYFCDLYADKHKSDTESYTIHTQYVDVTLIHGQDHHDTHSYAREWRMEKTMSLDQRTLVYLTPIDGPATATIPAAALAFSFALCFGTLIMRLEIYSVGRNCEGRCKRVSTLQIQNSIQINEIM